MKKNTSQHQHLNNTATEIITTTTTTITERILLVVLTIINKIGKIIKETQERLETKNNL